MIKRKYKATIIVLIPLTIVIISFFLLFDSTMNRAYIEKYKSGSAMSYDNCEKTVLITYSAMEEMEDSVYKDPLIPAKTVNVRIYDSNMSRLADKAYNGQVLSFYLDHSIGVSRYYIVVDVKTFWLREYTIDLYPLDIEPNECEINEG